MSSLVSITKVCLGVCGRDLPLDSYNLHPRGKFGRQPRCKDCKRNENRIIKERNPEKAQASVLDWRKRNPELVRAYGRKYMQKPRSRERHWEIGLKRFYGITPERYWEVFENQQGKCSICSRSPEEGEKLHVDHCHSTNKVRGLLCGKCNRGLGMFDDSPNLLLRAVEYLSSIEQI